ncbi:MAG: 23S rRNA (pseudouridine(1915)-N(3))-methyltransferase RlmH [Erysipelotrichaceae bacterium]|nr:23S rRNA (pseudouridine(1915)-N(3))-methyltransferase RlmH [Erysipelotrichaceae bacterium]
MIKLVVVGKLKEKALLMLTQEYIKRLAPYTKLEVVEVADEQAPQTNSQAQNEQVKEKEGDRILAKIREKEYVILLDLKGEMLSSEQFAETLEKIQLYQSSEITFVIGGSLGISKAVIQRANMRWKLSDLTFTHQMVRILLLEQVYRSYKIRHHEPYHK